MKNGISRKIYLSIALFGLSFLSFTPASSAQDSFREFDRKHVMTPAELYDALSTLNPSLEKRPSVTPRRQKEFEEASRNFLSQLTPKQQEKAWEFAEKYLRKNGVDAASSRELMKELRLPPEIQSELAKQFRKFNNRKSSSDTNRKPNSKDTEPDDEISRLLRKAKAEFEKIERRKRGSSDINRSSGDAIPEDRPNQSAEKEQGRSNADTPPGDARVEKRSTPRNGDRPGTTNPGPKRKPTRPRSGGEPETPFGQPFSNSENNLTESELRKRFENRESQKSQSANRNPNTTGRNSSTVKPSDIRKNSSGADANIEQLLQKLGGLPNRKIGKNGTNDRRGINSTGLNPDIDWEKVIKGLAERDISGMGAASQQGNSSTTNLANKLLESGTKKPNIDKDMFGRARELFSKALKNRPEGSRGSPNAGDGVASREKIGTRFDRLLVKAVDRTLTSEGDEGVSKGVSGMLGNLIERFQDQASGKKEEREREEASRRSSTGNKYSNNRQRSSSSNNAGSASNRSNSRSRQNSSSSPRKSPAVPETPSPGSGSLSDMVPDLSGINPMYVFTFFAIVGGVLFLGYVLAQTIAGSETESTKRAVMKKVRETAIRSPQDLVETVDMFLLAKFGIKSSWWNASVAQRVLHSGSPELQTQVDELFRDYIRARYMRNDIQIPAPDQQRFKKTLEELSKLDIMPEKRLGYASSTKPTVSLEG